MSPAKLPPMSEGHNIVRRRWPEVAAAVDDAAGLEAEVTPHPPFTLRVAGVHITSVVDRRAEAVLQSSLVPEDAVEAWVYGVALGDLPEILLGRPALQKLHVVVMSAGLFDAALGLEPMAWLADPRVSLTYGASRPHRPFAAAPGVFPFTDDRCLALRDALLDILDVQPQRAQSEALFEETQRHISTNVARDDPSVVSLFGPRRDATVVVVGAGPTLPERTQWLASARPGAVIAVSRALVPLLNSGIQPDVVVVTDPKEVTTSHLGGVDLDQLRDVSLVYAAGVTPRFPDFWTGSRYLASIPGPAYEAMPQHYQAGRLFSDGSVIHSAIDLAVRMGAARIILIGVDFATPDDQSHAADSVAQTTIQGPRLTVVDGHGDRVSSIRNLIAYLRSLERYVALHPEVAFLNTGRRGAQIAGTGWLD